MNTILSDFKLCGFDTRVSVILGTEKEAMIPSSSYLLESGVLRSIL